ncbi:cupin domain-containing protein [Bosea sp. Leaf344]|uniref:cupin domain-containing protein n=1 Tax=Bosea sp. Leaf344 TaxID=1736346 RepID=UPI0009EAA963|nr:cupin domain-containing protein [Bosea sp. Leaf344]
MRSDFDLSVIEANGRSAAKAQLFEPQPKGPWRGNVEGARLDAPLTILAYGNETPGEGPLLHVHPYDEVFIVVAGNARFFVGDEVIDATAGDIVLGPAGVPHRFENLGPGRLQTIDIHHSPKWLQVDIGTEQPS